jgi:hypothetical protein
MFARFIGELIFEANNIFKDVNYLIKISKDEATYLREHGRGKDIHLSSATHKARAVRYYLTQSFKSMKLLNSYRASKIISTYDGR